MRRAGEIAIDERVHRPRLRQRPPRKRESMTRIEREIQVHPERDRSVGGGLSGERNRQAVESADMRDLRASAMARRVIGKVALPIDPVGSRPIG